MRWINLHVRNCWLSSDCWAGPDRELLAVNLTITITININIRVHTCRRTREQAQWGTVMSIYTKHHRSSLHSHTVILNHPNLAVHIELINWAVLQSSHAKSVIAADLYMSSLTDVKLGSLCWTFISRCRLSISHLKHRSSQWSQSSSSSIPHSLHNLSSL